MNRSGSHQNWQNDVFSMFYLLTKMVQEYIETMFPQKLLENFTNNNKEMASNTLKEMGMWKNEYISNINKHP